jgi:hypothetical protein
VKSLSRGTTYNAACRERQAANQGQSFAILAMGFWLLRNMRILCRNLSSPNEEQIEPGGCLFAAIRGIVGVCRAPFTAGFARSQRDCVVAAFLKRRDATALSGTLRRADSFVRITSFKGHMQGALSVTFSPDGRRLASGGGSGRDAVKLWDLVNYRELVTLTGQGTLFLFTAFSPDGNW